MREALRRMPKAELHVHLDGSLRPATMLELAATAGVSLPAPDAESLRRWMLVDDARNLEDYLARFDVTIALLQRPEAIERVAYEMVEDAAADGLRYLEIRYCPQLSVGEELSLDEVIEAEWRGLQRGFADFGVPARIINCSLRHYDPELSLVIAEHSVRMRSHGVVGFDLAGGEAGRPCELHREAFDLAARGGPRHHGARRRGRGLGEHLRGDPQLPRGADRPRHAAVREPGAARVCARPPPLHRGEHHLEPADPRGGHGGPASGAPVLRCGHPGDALHRLLADERRGPDRRVSSGTAGPRLHPHRARDDGPHRLRACLPPLA
ncbi:MAG: hypothetical protein IPO52_14560 [Gemmatimonadetes bacterium]|nr:hypothetical protein [Gemmatimonadota bacterium]